MTKKKPPQKADPRDKPFFRPFEAVAKERLAEKALAEKAALAEKKAAPLAAQAKPGAKGPPAAAAKGTARPPRAEPPPADGKPGDLSSMSFAEMMYGVTPIARGPLAEPKALPAPKTEAGGPPQAEIDADAAVREHLRSLVSGGDARFEVSDDGQRIEGRRIDTDTHVVRRLRRGEMMVDVKCDLHGLGSHEARARVEERVQWARSRGERVLLIIHGKGDHSPRGMGVLRGEMAAWLSQGAASVHVAAFVTALPDDGGEGALYVLLRK